MNWQQEQEEDEKMTYKTDKQLARDILAGIIDAMDCDELEAAVEITADLLAELLTIADGTLTTRADLLPAPEGAPTREEKHERAGAE